MDGSRDLTLLAFGGTVCSDCFAFADLSSVVVAGIHGVLENVHVPSVQEVTVKTVTSCVTVGEDKRMLGAVPLIREEIGVVKNLVEDRDHVDREVIGAVTSVVLGRVAYVRLVIRSVEISAVPTSRKEHLGAKAIGTIVIWYVGRLGLIGADACV